MPSYDFQLCATNGTKLCSLINLRNRKYSYVLNGPGAAGGQLNLNDPIFKDAAFLPYFLQCEMQKDLAVYRNGVKVWRGRVTQGQDTYNASTQAFELSALGYLSLLENRYVRSALTYTQVDQGVIAWNLISHTQGFDDLGIRAGRLTTGVLRDRTYNDGEHKQIRDALEELAGLEDGFDFEITPDLVFNVYYPRKSNVIGEYQFALPANIKDFSRQIDGMKVINYCGVTGGDGTTEQIAFDQDSINAYGLHESYQTFTDIVEDATLLAKAQAIVDQYKNPYETITQNVSATEPPLGSYGVGDIIRDKVKLGRLEIDTVKRIQSIEIEIDENNAEKVTPILAEA